MSHRSHDGGHQAIDLDGTEPLVDTNDPERWIDEDLAEAAARAFQGRETQRWFGYLIESGMVGAGWGPSGDDAIDQLWSAVLRRVESGSFEGCGWSEVAAHPPVPLWLRLNPGPESVVGWQGAQFSAAIVAGATRWLERTWNAEWGFVESYRDTPATPVIRIPEGRGMLLHSQIPVKVSQAIRGLPEALEPESLRNLLHRHGPGTAEPYRDDSEEPDGPEWMLDPWEDSDFNWGLSMDDLTAHEEEDRVEQLARLLDRHPGIRRCIHSDRELILMTSDLDHGDLMGIIEQLWESTGHTGDL